MHGMQRLSIMCGGDDHEHLQRRPSTFTRSLEIKLNGLDLLVPDNE